jgi:curved DNA-binding protein
MRRMAVQYKDYYETLGVPKTASDDEIRKAFRKLARTHHPDVAKDKKTAEAKFKEINEAYEVLGDPEKRRKYDTLGADWETGGSRQPPPGWGGRAGGGETGEGGFSFGGTGFSDFFEQFFAGRSAGRRGGGGSGTFTEFGRFGADEMRGSDIEADLLVTIEEALHGAKKKISFRRNGSSRVETYEVRIPKGVREGQRIRLAGQGGAAGGGGAAAGDLYLRVRFERHPDYQMEGADLVYELELPAWRAVLGTEVAVPTPDGEVKLKIPPLSQPGRKFRLRGRGLPRSGGARGDFYVALTLTLPTKLTPEQEQLWARLGEQWR